MKARYRLIRRRIRGGAFYSVDTKTGRRTSLGTANPDDAAQIIEAKNIAERQPVLNLQIAKAYLAGTDSGLTTRTWQQAMETLNRAMLAGVAGKNHPALVLQGEFQQCVHLFAADLPSLSRPESNRKPVLAAIPAARSFRQPSPDSLNLNDPNKL